MQPKRSVELGQRMKSVGCVTRVQGLLLSFFFLPWSFRVLRSSLLTPFS